VATLAATLAAIALFGLLTGETSLVGRLRDVRPPAVLADRAASALGDDRVSGPAGETAQRFVVDWSYFHDVARRDRSADRWNALDHGRSPLQFLWELKGRPADAESEAVSMTPGATVLLDHAGRLVELHVSSPSGSRRSGPPDWPRLFTLAGLDLNRFSHVAPRIEPPMDADLRLAWEGPDAGDPTRACRVELAALGGRTVLFKVLDAAAASPATGAAFSERMHAGRVLEASVLLLSLLGAVWLAIRNLRSGRGDREGAQRLAIAFLGSGLVVQLLRRVPLVRLERGIVTAPGLGEVLLLGALVFILYLAAEPFVRRRWPRTQVGWARLLGARRRDPIVGRDVLAGVLVGMTVSLMLAFIRTPAFGVVMPPFAPFVPNGEALASTTGLLAAILRYAMESVAFGLGVLVALVLLHTVTRSDVVAFLLSLIAVLLPHAAFGIHPTIPFLAVHVPIFYLSIRLMRHTGLLAFIVFYFTFNLCMNVIGSCGWTTWTGRQGLFSLAVLTLLALWGFRQTLGTRIVVFRTQTTTGSN
jgi:hypothetical protein